MSEILVNTIKKADGTGSITVPADTGTVLTSATALSNFPSGFANGITEIDAWRLSTTTAVTNDNTIDTNWERVSGDGFVKLGTGLSESSGQFSFPSTGYWWINVFATYNRTNGSSSQAGISLNYTSNNFSGNSDAAEGEDSTSATNFRGHVSFTFMFKITDITNQKFRFRMFSSSPSGTEFLGNSGKSLTGFTIYKAAEV